MRVDSDILKTRRLPQQERGERRVAELLQAAASEFADVGYEAATMKAIAERAGSSIGAIYQYFPNKQAVVSALRNQYVSKMEEHWIRLEEATAGLSIQERTQKFVDVMIRFIEEHPAYITILDAPVDSKQDKKTKDHLRERLANVFHTRRPGISRKEAYRVACVSLEIIKSMNTLYTEAKPQDRIEIVREYKLALTAYLEKRLTPSRRTKG
jgi:AcrR family transcriptional regulator